MILWNEGEQAGLPLSILRYIESLYNDEAEKLYMSWRINTSEYYSLKDYMEFQVQGYNNMMLHKEGE